MRTPSLMIAAGAAALALSGCGPSAEQRFRDEQLAPVQRRVEQDKAQLSAILKVARLGHKTDARAAASLVAQLARAVAQMAALDAPSSVAPAFRDYVEANRRLVGSLRTFSVRLGGHSQSKLEAEADAAQAAATEIARTRAALYAGLSG